MGNTLGALILAGNLIFTPVVPTTVIVSPLGSESAFFVPKKEVIAYKTMNLNTRNKSEAVSEIFRDNILLNLHYIKGDVKTILDKKNSTEYQKVVDWDKVRKPFEFSLTLDPNELLSFHDELLPEYKGMKVKTGWTQFSVADGYKVLDGLSGNGVCHLATIFNWVSSEAGLFVNAPTNHDFYPVPEVPREYGTSIIYIPGAYTTQLQNLYVVNNFSYPVTYEIKADKDKVEMTIVK